MKNKIIVFALLIFSFLFPIHAQTGWSAPLQLSRNGVWPDLMIGEPAVTVDSNGAIYAFWAISLEIDGDWSNGWYSQIEYRKSIDGGLTWTATQNITLEYTDQRIYAIEAVCDTKNNVHLVYMRGSENCKVMYKKFNGTTWTEPYEVYPYGGSHLKLGIDSDDRIYAIWNLTSTSYYSYFENDVWTLPKKLGSNDFGVYDIKFDKNNILYAIGSCYETVRPYLFIYDKSVENWISIEDMKYNPDQKILGCGLSISNSDSLFANTSYGPYIDVNTDHHLSKSLEDSLWSGPTLFGVNNAWDREMFIDKNGSLHLFELHFYEGDTNGDMGQIHSEYKNGIWSVESIDSLHNFSYTDPNVAYDRINNKIFTIYQKYDRTRSIMRIYFQAKQIVSGIEDATDNIPESSLLFQNYPNPFNNSSRISYSIPQSANVKISIFNIKGEFIQNLINNKQDKGHHSVIFNADNLNSGIYYYQLEVDGITKETKKMLYLK